MSNCFFFLSVSLLATSGFDLDVVWMRADASGLNTAACFGNINEILSCGKPCTALWLNIFGVLCHSPCARSGFRVQTKH